MSRPVALTRSLIDRVFPRGALLLSFLSFVYFVAGSKYLGGTVWQRILYK